MKYPSRDRAYSRGDSWQGYLSLDLNALFPVCVKGIQMPGKKLITIFIGCGKQSWFRTAGACIESSPSEKRRTTSECSTENGKSAALTEQGGQV